MDKEQDEDAEYSTYKDKDYPVYKDTEDKEKEDWMRPTQEFNALTEHSADWTRIKEKHKEDWSSAKNFYADDWSSSKKDQHEDVQPTGNDWSGVRDEHKKDWSEVKTNYEHDWPSAYKYSEDIKPVGLDDTDWLQASKEDWRDQDRDQSSPDSQSRDELESPNLPYVQGALKIQLTDRGYNGTGNSNGEKFLFTPRSFDNKGSDGDGGVVRQVDKYKNRGAESSDDEGHESSEEHGEVVGSFSFKIPTAGLRPEDYSQGETFKEHLNSADDKDVDEMDFNRPNQFMNSFNRPLYSSHAKEKEEENSLSNSDDERNASPNYMVEKPGDGIWKMREHDSETEKNKTQLRNGDHEEPTELEMCTETKSSNFLESEPVVKEGLVGFSNSDKLLPSFPDSTFSSLQINGLCKTKVNLFFNILQKLWTRHNSSFVILIVSEILLNYTIKIIL